MTREEAIQHIIGAWIQRDHEFLSESEEYKASEIELVTALRAIGVRDDELPDNLRVLPSAHA